MKKIHMGKLARSSMFVFALSMVTNVLTYAYQHPVWYDYGFGS